MKNDDKQNRILDAAAELFASRPFHKVLLSDVASKAAVGKGTLYLYFESKEALYMAVLFREFSAIVDRLLSEVEQNHLSPEEQMEGIIHALVNHLFGNAFIAELTRGTVLNCPSSGEWMEKRQALWDLIESVIRRGMDKGVFHDGDPRLTARYVPGLIRSTALFRPQGVELEAMTEHATTFVLNSLKG